MTDLHSALQRYLNMRKGFGFKYQHQTRRLADFVSFMDKCKATTITTKHPPAPPPMTSSPAR